MEPITPKIADIQRPQRRSIAPKVQIEKDEPLVVPTDQFQQLGTSQAPAEATESKPKSKPEPVEAKAPPVPVPAFQDSPQAIIEEPLAEATQVGGTGKTLAELTAEITKPKSVGPKKDPLPAPPSDPAKLTAALRMLGHGFLKFLGGDELKPFKKGLEEVNKLESMAKALKTPAQFQVKTSEFKARLAKGESLEDIREEAYAVARQASVLTLGMRHYDCQVLGALAMDDGHIAEMRTGEGKTLTAVMPLYLNALAGKGAHLVTVNDALASRDAKDMGPVFEMMGLTVGTVLEDMKTDDKRAGYAADITYTTDRALGFDYLRDVTAKSPSGRVQREPFFALVDEVDEVFIDEARSPLIVSADGDSFASEYEEFNAVVSQLEANTDYFVDHKKHVAWLSETGHDRVENILQKRELQRELKTATPERSSEIQAELQKREELDQAISVEQARYNSHRGLKKEQPGLIARWKGAEVDEEGLEKSAHDYESSQNKTQELLSQLPVYDLYSEENCHRARFLNAALKAHALFEADHDYSVMDGAVQIVDENKGRTSDGRRYNDGIHQALEAKEGVKIGNDKRTIASITLPNLFKRYPRLAGMSGTAKTSEYEFLELYKLDVVQIPTNKPIIRKEEPDIVFRTLDEKYEAIARDAAADYHAGRPVLIGTLSVEHNEHMAKLMLEAGVPEESLQVLNAETVRDSKEWENFAIKQAGRSGKATIATSVAGRGANYPYDRHNFMMLAKKTHEAFQTNKPVVVDIEKKEDAEMLQSWLATLGAKAVSADKTQTPKPGQIQIRYTEDVEKPAKPDFASDTVHINGADFPGEGLHFYGAERSTSRRIDDQFIGRSGRQGAPGWARFYLSLEDDLLRIFAGDKLDSVMSHFITPGEGVSNILLDKLIAQAQSSIEQDHFASREKTNERDEVLNKQRGAFFSLRDDLLGGGPELKQRLNTMVSSAVKTAMSAQLEDKNKFTLKDIKAAASSAQEDLNMAVDLPFLESDVFDAADKMSAKELEAEIDDLVSRKTDRIFRTLKSVTGQDEAAVRPAVLDTVDEAWADHLEEMETLSLGVEWQAKAEKDPEVEFKLQGFDLFGESVDHINRQVVRGPYSGFLTFCDVLAASAEGAKDKAAKAL